MKLANLKTVSGMHLAAMTDRGVVDLTAAGCVLSLQDLVCGADCSSLGAYLTSDLPTVEDPVFGNIVDPVGKVLCVGLNYRAHALAAGFELPKYPTLFSKFDNAMVPHGAKVQLPPWEISYDYEAELVIVMGKTAWGVSEDEAMDCIFGYTCGNDLSCRDSQQRSGQWLIGKTMPGFGPCGPWIVTSDSFNPNADHAIRSYVNGELRQNSLIIDMIFNCAEIVSYASKYVKLEPGDVIFTGTPSGVALEKKELGNERWLKAGDVVDVEIEGIGTLSNTMI